MIDLFDGRASRGEALAIAAAKGTGDNAEVVHSRPSMDVEAAEAA
jgi:hypothetical protein